MKLAFFIKTMSQKFMHLISPVLTLPMKFLKLDISLKQAELRELDFQRLLPETAKLSLRPRELPKIIRN